MKKKIICIGILSMFLLITLATSFTAEAYVTTNDYEQKIEDNVNFRSCNVSVYVSGTVKNGLRGVSGATVKIYQEIDETNQFGNYNIHLTSMPKIVTVESSLGKLEKTVTDDDIRQGPGIDVYVNIDFNYNPISKSKLISLPTMIQNLLCLLRL